MEAPVTVKQLFAPLSDRLSYFEADRFSTVDFYVHETWEDFDEHTPDIFEIVKGAHGFDPEEVYEEAKLHEERAADILQGIKPLTHINTVDEYKQYEKIEVPEGMQKSLLKRWMKELTLYIKELQLIQKLALKRIGAKAGKEMQKGSAFSSNQTALPQAQSIQINLPENFTVKQLNKDFDPQLSINQVALFLYYLREQAIMPSYSDSAIGKLAEAFFVRNQKNVTKGLTDIYSIKSNKGELTSLKKVLQNLIKEIDNDLKEAR